MSAIPTIAYSFDDVGGNAVPNNGAAGARYDGALVGAKPPQIVDVNPSPAGGSYVRFFGGQINASRLDVGDVKDPSTELNPILGESSSTLAFYIRSAQFGLENPAQSPGLTGVDGPGDSDLFLGSPDPLGRLRSQARGDPATVSPKPVVDGLWHHVALTRDVATGERRVYVDGELVAASFGTTGPLTTPFRSLGALSHVSSVNQTAADSYLGLSADVDQVEVFNSALSGPDIARRYGPAASAPPSTISDLAADVGYQRSVRLLFSPVAAAAGYRVLRSDSPDGPFLAIGEVPVDPYNPDAPIDFFDADRPVGATAHYRVVPFNAAGEGSASDVAATPTAAGKGVSHLQTGVAKFRDVEFAWTDDAGGTLRYELRRSTGGGPFVKLSGAVVTTNSAVDREAEAGTTYRYRIVGLDAEQRVVAVSETITVATALLPSSAELTALPSAVRSPDWLTEANGKLYFRRFESDQDAALYVADGATGEVRRLGPVVTGAATGFARPMALGDRIVYAGKDNIHGVELWSSDGTPAGTKLLKDVVPGVLSSSPVGFTPLGSAMLFLVSLPGGDSQYQLWRTDGTAAGTFEVLNGLIVSAYFGSQGEGRAFMRLGDTLYFRGASDQPDYQLWRTDGTTAGTRIFKDLIPNAPELSWDLGSWGVQNGRLFFLGSGTQQGPGQLFSLDGTVEGTFQVPQTTISFGRMVESNGRLYLSHGYAIWTINDAGNRVIHLQEAPANEYIRELAPAGDGGLFYFTAHIGTNQSTISVWKSSGVADKAPQRLDSYNEADFGASNFQYDAFNGGLVYHANGILTVSDGTPQDTVHVAATHLDGFRPYDSGPLGAAVGKRYYYMTRESDGDEIRYISLDDPAAPADLATQVADNGAVEITWDDRAANETGYLVQRLLVQNAGLPNETEVEQALFLLQANSERFVDRPAGDGAYRYRVLAYNTLGRVSAPAESAVVSNDIHPPQVAGVAVSGSAWSETFSAFTDAARRGDGAINVTDESRQLPWADVDRVSIQFSEDVVVAQEDLIVTPQGGERIAAVAFSYDPAARRATWTLDRSLPAGRTAVALSSDVADRAGLKLADAGHHLNILPGDVDGDGKVAATDLVKVRNRIGLQAAGFGAARKGYSPEADVNADGAITAADLVLVRNRVGTVAAPVPSLFQFARRIQPERRQAEDILATVE